MGAQCGLILLCCELDNCQRMVITIDTIISLYFPLLLINLFGSTRCLPWDVLGSIKSSISYSHFLFSIFKMDHESDNSQSTHLSFGPANFSGSVQFIFKYLLPHIQIMCLTQAKLPIFIKEMKYDQNHLPPPILFRTNMFV